MDKYGYFTSFIYREERPEWVEKATECSLPFFEEINSTNISASTFSNLAFQTRDLSKIDSFAFFHSFIRDKAVSIMKDQGYYTDDHDFYVSALWGQRLLYNSGHPMHTHASTLITGLYFLETPEHGSFPIFSDPRPGKEMAELPVDLRKEAQEGLLDSSPNVFFNNVVPGTFLFFNSWLPHLISFSNTEEDTKLLHFMVGANRRFV